MKKILSASLICTILLGFGICNEDGNASNLQISDGVKSYSTDLDKCSLNMDLSKIPELRGPRGEKGERGNTGPQGKPGPSGYPGLLGAKGSRGDKGLMGLTGVDGQLGKFRRLVCNETLDEKYVVLPKDKLEVKADKDTNLTCLMVKDLKNTEYIEKYAINFTSGLKSYWLSNNNFDFQQFYNNVTWDQLNWLQNSASTITQTIRFYFKGGDDEKFIKELRMLGWNDLVFGFEDEQYPQTFSYSDILTDEWQYVDIHIASKNSMILPVRDIKIANFPSLDHRVFFKILELCFEY